MPREASPPHQYRQPRRWLGRQEQLSLLALRRHAPVGVEGVCAGTTPRRVSTISVTVIARRVISPDVIGFLMPVLV